MTHMVYGPSPILRPIGPFYRTLGPKFLLVPSPLYDPWAMDHIGSYTVVTKIQVWISIYEHFLWTFLSFRRPSYRTYIFNFCKTYSTTTQRTTWPCMVHWWTHSNKNQQLFCNIPFKFNLQTCEV